MNLMVFLFTVSMAVAGQESFVVFHYSEAANPQLWEQVKRDQIPSEFLKEVLVEDQAFRIRGGKNNSKDHLEQNTISFWLSSYSSYLEKSFKFSPPRSLKVFSQLSIKDDNSRKALQNKAYYNPQNQSLNFFPASKTGFNRSGYDPSIIVHEMTHVYFQHLFPHAINSEIDGLNEGFADFMTNIFFEDPRIGLILMKGHAMRDSSQPLNVHGQTKSYRPRMSAHELGEIVSYALWETRKKFSNPSEFNQLVVEAIAELSQNSYSTILDFKNILVQKLPFNKEDGIYNFWERLFPDSAPIHPSLDFLERPISSKTQAYTVRRIVGERVSQQLEIEKEIQTDFTLHDSENNSEETTAFLVSNSSRAPFWIVINHETQSALGAYQTNKVQLTEKETKESASLIRQILSAQDFIYDFKTKIKMYAQLAEGKGPLKKTYKIKGRKETSTEMDINGSVSKVDILDLKIDTKFFIELFSKAKLADITHLRLIKLGPRFIGYKILLKSGNGQEVIMNQFN